MTSKVLVLGFDACEITLVERWIAEGRLPNLERLHARSRTFRLDNPMETLPGAIWPEINTGVSSGRMGDFYIPSQLRTGESRLRATLPDDIDPDYYYWSQASRGGRRVAVIDPVQAVPVRGLNGIQLYEWGLHDRTFRIESNPPEILANIRSRFGDHPVTSCDTHGETIAGYRRLREQLLYGVHAKSVFVPELLDREAWDLFVCTFSESHCAGHQFWHFLDSRHPWHDARGPADLRGALLAVYQGIDNALGKVLPAAGDDATVFAVFSHGIDLYYDGPQLLPEILVRLGLASGDLGRVGNWLRQLKTHVTYLPRPVKKVIKRFARTRALQGPAAAAGCLVDPFESPRTRAAFVNNNRCGGIRLNLRGREPYGCVAPGDEAASLVARLKRELLSLRDPISKATIVERVVTADEQFGPDHHPDLPDLICVFRTDLGMIERCISPSIGEVQVPIYHPHAPRSGDHTVNSRLWASGPAVRASSVMEHANVLDVAPTVLDALGVARPDWLSGQPLPLREQRMPVGAASHAVAGIR